MKPYAVYINEAALASAPRSGSQYRMVEHFMVVGIGLRC